MTKNKRQINFFANKYQRRIMALAFFPTAIICLTMMILMKYFYLRFVDILIFESSSESIMFLNQWITLVLLSTGILFVLIILWAYAISRDMVGAFARILRDLDTIIQGGQRKHIYARKGDDPAGPLVKRINVLIDNLPSEKKLGH